MSILKSLAGNGFCREEDVPCVINALVSSLLFFAPFLFGFTVMQAAAFVALLTIVDGRVNYLLHWHVHRPFTRAPSFNLLLDLILGATTGITASNWRIQHVYGHHAGVDAAFRAPGAYMEGDYSPCRALVFCFRSLWPSMVSPLVEAFDKGVRDNVTSPINYRWAFAEQCLFVGFVAVMLTWRPALTAFVLAPWYVALIFCTRYVDYMNHYGCDESGTNPIALANNTLHAGYNKFSGNLGYHTAHHLDAGAHWSDLPALHRAVADRVDPRHVKNFSWSFLYFPCHLWLFRQGRM